MGLFKIIFAILGALILAVVGIGAYLYFTDYGAQASVTGKGSDSQGDYVLVTPDLWPSYHLVEHLDSKTAQVVCVGYKVTFHVNTHHTLVYDAKNVLVYDSDKGPTDTTALAKCAASNGSGGIF